MVSSKSTTFVFCLVFISTSLNSSLAYTNQVTRKIVVENDNGFTMTSGSSLRHMEHKEILNGGDDEAGKGKMVGRKMMVERKDMMSKGKKKEEGGESLTTSATTTSSNGNCSEYSCTVGNYSHKGQGKMMRMQRKLRIIRSTDSIKDNPGGFMAFNADYHMARPHPPKNN